MCSGLLWARPLWRVHQGVWRGRWGWSGTSRRLQTYSKVSCRLLSNTLLCFRTSASTNVSETGCCCITIHYGRSVFVDCPPQSSVNCQLRPPVDWRWQLMFTAAFCCMPYMHMRILKFWHHIGNLDSVSWCVFTWRTIVPNVILIWCEITEPWAFLKSIAQTRTTKRWVLIWDEFLIQKCRHFY